jgi:hypothetical protein
MEVTMRRKFGRLFNEVFLHYEKYESQNRKGEKAKKIVFTVKSIIVISLSVLSLLLKKCS